mmetsp:Transcript_6894/g.10289  ORF Transcript_6894/g.10289 Transcript_6894/m.10289 type:complete len:91 (-) Transcript_6894:1226-1498(-)
MLQHLQKQKPMSDIAAKMKELANKMQQDRNELRQRLRESEETIQMQSEVIQALLDCLSKGKQNQIYTTDELLSQFCRKCCVDQKVGRKAN